ncbi:ABC transporter substrate-binding protein [Galactobacter valiniphilus]|uniref:ABC transporter substrate-binding protein n=1 Tax=Galactobacter valiniphilus TaxID=2676122 RepID=UPI003734ED98
MRTSPRTSTFQRLSRTLTAAALVAAIPLGTAGAASAASLPQAVTAESAAATSGDNVLRIATSGFVDSFNPFISIYLLPTNSIRYMYESLVQNGQEDGSPTKGLANHWETSTDGKTWTFTLQDNLKWSDDQPITSADVKYTYEQMMTVPDLGTANGNLVQNFESVETPDDKTVVIKLKSSQAPNPGVEIPIVPKHIWEKIDNPADFKNEENVVGSGPFLLKSYKANESITFTANKNFWQGAPKIDGLQYIYYTNSDAQVQALRSGDVDLVAGLTPTQYKALEGAEGVTVHSGEGRRYSSISINPGLKTRTGESFGTGNAALQDKEVRQAIRLGTDTKTLLEKVQDNQGVLATSFIPASFPKWTLSTENPVIQSYDPVAAKKKLEDDGWTVGSDGIREKDGKKLKLRLLVDSEDSTEQSIAEYFKPWMKEIGIDIDVQSSDGDTISTKATEGDYDMYFSGWSVNPDPDYQLGINTCFNLPTKTDGTGGTTQDGYCNEEFDKLYNQQHSEMDETKRQELVQQMLAQNYEDTVQVATWYANGLEAYRSDRFTNFGLMPKEGGIIANQAGYWGFLSVERVEGSTAGGGAVNTGLVVAGVVVGVVVIAGVVVFLLRRRKISDVE